jgi:hypothetical protein
MAWASREAGGQPGNPFPRFIDDYGNAVLVEEIGGGETS